MLLKYFWSSYLEEMGIVVIIGALELESSKGANMYIGNVVNNPI